MQYLFGVSIFLTSLFLILLILIQRGRGGGLAGALGGMGGQSAFGTKAGDLFTRITIGVAAVWILLSVAAIAVLNQSNSVFGQGGRSVFSGGESRTPGDTTVPGSTLPGTPGTSALDTAVPGGATKDPELETGSKAASSPVGDSKVAPPAGKTDPGTSESSKSDPAKQPSGEASAPASNDKEASPEKAPPATPDTTPSTTPDKK